MYGGGWEEKGDSVAYGKKIYISEEERKKYKAVVDAFAELEDADTAVVDAGKYVFVKLQYYTPPTGFENDVTFTESRNCLRICVRNGCIYRSSCWQRKILLRI